MEHPDGQQLSARARSPETLQTVGPDPGGGHTGRRVRKSCAVTLGALYSRNFLRGIIRSVYVYFCLFGYTVRLAGF